MLQLLTFYVGQTVQAWRRVDRPHAPGSCNLSVKDDQTDTVLTIEGPEMQHDMHIVEDWKSSPKCTHAPIKMSAAVEAMRNSRAAAAAAPDDAWPDVSAVAGLGELSRMAIEVYDVDVSNKAKELLLGLVDMWEEIPGALYKTMHENGGVAVGRLRDEVARQRLVSLEEDVVERAIMAINNRGAPPTCSKCKYALMSAGERAPVICLPLFGFLPDPPPPPTPFCSSLIIVEIFCA